MNRNYDELEPKEIFRHFKTISGIPRGSKKEKGISNYLKKFAEDRGFEAHQDATFNLLIKKPGTPGREDEPAVILQAHMDMVWNKEEGFDFDFETQPIKLVVEEDVLHSDRTTLGADDGIGVAFILALLEARDVSHPPLELLITTQEELGMGGAKEFDVTLLKGKTFINIDSEDEGIFCSSCCGGIRIYIKLRAEEIKAEQIPDFEKYIFMGVELGNLKGGHSGTEIDKERGNSNRLLGRVLYSLNEKYDYYLSEINGGIAPNAISSRTKAVILVKKEDEEGIIKELADWNDIFLCELRNSDGKPDESGTSFNVKITVSQEKSKTHVFTKDVLERVITAVTLFTHGVAAMDLNLHIPETSDNFAMIDTKADGEGSYILFSSNVRSSVATKKDFIRHQFTTIARVIGASYTTDGEYPAWEYDDKSEIRKIFVRAYKETYGGAEPKIEGIHAGLECGIFSEHFKKAGQSVDLIAYGPDIFGAHTPQERILIPSVGRSYKLLIKVLSLIGKGEF